MTKVFIFDSEPVSPQSRDDLKELLTSQGPTIFGRVPDITFSDFQFNHTGLEVGEKPTFVVPGGAALRMGALLRERLPFTLLSDPQSACNFNYVGICAGGFIATDIVHICAPPTFKIDSEGAFVTSPSEVVFTNKDVYKSHAPGVVQDYGAIGPFFPNNEYNIPEQYLNSLSREEIREFKQAHLKRLNTNKFTPYVASIQFTQTQQQVQQLYVGGCGFFRTPQPENCSSLAIYNDNSRYSFFSNADQTKSQLKEYSPLSCIIGKKATPTAPGVFLSGTHIESCVSGSKILAAFSEQNYRADNEYIAFPLSEKQHECLENARDETEKHIIRELSYILKP